jgi:hypothetical protein
MTGGLHRCSILLDTPCRTPLLDRCTFILRSSLHLLLLSNYCVERRRLGEGGRLGGGGGSRSVWESRVDSLIIRNCLIEMFNFKVVKSKSRMLRTFDSFLERLKSLVIGLNT